MSPRRRSGLSSGRTQAVSCRDSTEHDSDCDSSPDNAPEGCTTSAMVEAPRRRWDVGLRQQRGGAPPSGAGPAPKQKNDAAAKQPNVNDDSATHELIAVAYASPPIG